MGQIHELKIEKRTTRTLAPEIGKRQLDNIVKRALAGDRGKHQGWSLITRIRIPDPQKVEGGLLYRVSLPFKKGRKAEPEIVQRQFEYLTKIAATAGNSDGWRLVDSDSPAVVAAVPATAGISVITDTEPHFRHIFDRKEQIGIVNQAITAAIQSHFANRNHCVLYGPPACGKSDILLGFKAMYGADNVLQFDATSTTAAGARKELRELEKIPPILICEEIEKTDEGSLRWLLGVLDTRGEIRGLNYRDSSYSRDVKLLCLATVNDMDKFNNAMSGALASRFANKIKCPRPSRAVLEKILEREIAKIKGKPEWIVPAINYCVEIEGTDDPRRVIAVALCGQDKLLNGEYQGWLEATSEVKPKGPPVRKQAPVNFSMEGLF